MGAGKVSDALNVEAGSVPAPWTRAEHVRSSRLAAWTGRVAMESDFVLTGLLVSALVEVRGLGAICRLMPWT
jgi:hypothetical protein